MSAADRRERCCSSFCGRHFRVSADRLGQVRSPAVLFDGFAHFLSSSSERTDSVSSSQEPVNFWIPSFSRNYEDFVEVDTGTGHGFHDLRRLVVGLLDGLAGAAVIGVGPQGLLRHGVHRVRRDEVADVEGVGVVLVLHAG